MLGTYFPYNALKLFQSNRDILTHAFCYYVTNDLYVAVGGKTEAIKGQYVYGEYFSGMGVAPAAGHPLKHSKTIHRIIGEVDPRLAAFDVKTQTSHIDGTISQEITLARLGTIWAGLALIMVCVGLYGTVAYNVARRTREIGIRITLGAQRFGISWMVLRDIYISLLAGLAIGIPAALAGLRYLQSWHFGIKPNDPAAFIVAVAALLLAGSVAGCLPAFHASWINPTEALRCE
jgi:macrolide transport system ATP-binding/permease protein